MVDGEHYPPVTRWAVSEIEKNKGNVTGLIFLGGTEKVENAVEELDDEGYVIFMGGESFDETLEILKKAVRETGAEAVIDLSDEPILNYRKRFRIASHLMLERVSYIGADFVFEPPLEKNILNKPSISIIGTGKRVGKTGVSVSISRWLKNAGFRPVVVAMGRGGPEAPDIVAVENLELSPDLLLNVVKKGGHAASDYWEDAMLGGVTTLGCRRCGGGMAGNPFISNVIEGGLKIDGLNSDFIIMEGSGSTLPPVKTDASIVVVGANQKIENITGYFGEYRILKSKIAVVTMCEEPVADESKVRMIKESILKLKPEIKIALTIFRPQPLGKIEGKRVFLASTAKEEILDKLKEYIENEYDCEVKGTSGNLSRRTKLRRELKTGLNGVDVLLTEIKAASIDIAASTAREKGVDIVFLHNRPLLLGGNIEDIEKSIMSLCKGVRGDKL